MNKGLRLIFILTFMTYIGYSQVDFIPETNVGIKLGGNISTVRFDPTINQNINYGFIGGLSFKHIEQKNLGIQIELDYMQAGWIENLDSTQSYSRRLNYIHFPIMTHFNFGNNKARIFMNFGPYVSYLISESESIDNISEENEASYYRTKISNRAEFGLCLGLGFTQYTSVGIFQFEGRGNMSLSNIFKETSETPFVSSNNLTIELTLTYFLDYKTVKNLFLRKNN